MNYLQRHDIGAHFGRYTLLVLLMLPLLMLCSCLQTPPQDVVKDKGISILGVSFSKDYKNIYVKVHRTDSAMDMDLLTDSASLRYVIKEYQHNGSRMEQSHIQNQPWLTDIKNIRQEELKKEHINLLFLVDLSMNQEEITYEQTCLERMRQWFATGNLYVAFISDKGVSQTLPLTDYVLQNYFKPTSNDNKKLLYRSILCKLSEINGVPDSTYFPKVAQDEHWKSLKDNQKGLVILSNANVYNFNNNPIDQAHYSLQETLNSIHYKNGPHIYYVDCVRHMSDDYTITEDDEAVAVMDNLCKNTQGSFFKENRNSDTWLWAIISAFRLVRADYEFILTNPDNKIYNGKTTDLVIEVYNGKTLIACANTRYCVGNFYKPIVVNGVSIPQLILQGIIITIVLSLLIYLLMQIIIPFLGYLYFRHEYIISYRDKNMIYNGEPVAQSCYYCKSEFEEGDDIVVKCKHTMHLDCWRENDYKCPEYGRNCQHGSHYYNENNPFDYKNRPFYTNWMFMGILAALIGWVAFILGNGIRPNELILKVVMFFHNLSHGELTAQDILDKYAQDFHILPFLGFVINMTLTFGMSWLCERGNFYGNKIIISLLKALVAGAVGYLTFFLESMVYIILNMTSTNIILDWIPWLLNGFVIAYATAYATRIKINKKLLVIMMASAFFLMYLTTLLMTYMQLDTRDIMLINYIIYCIAIAISVSVDTPHSERFYLKVQGAIKEMDIALYKWMRTSPDYVVTIGKSVDCSLQMTWDLSGEIAPVHALISYSNHELILTALEEGITADGKPLEIDETFRLYHGRTFTIGNTIFTYIEKDS